MTKRFKDIKLRNKIMIIYICIGTIPLLLLGAYTYRQEWKARVDREHADMEVSLSKAVSQFDSKMMTYDKILEYTAGNINRNDSFTSSELSLFCNDDKVIKQLTVYVDGIDKKQGENIAPLSLMKKETGIAPSAVTDDVCRIIDNKSGALCLLKKVPFMKENEREGILCLKLDYKEIFSSFKGMSQYSYGIYVMDKDSKAVFSSVSNNGNDREIKLSAESVINEKENADNGKKSKYIVVPEKTCVDNWNVYMYKSSRMAGFSVKYLVVLFSGMFIFCMITCLIASKAFSRFVVKDIEGLKDNMLSVENGNLELMVESDAKDEVGSLVRSFGSMLSELKRLIHEVYESKLTQRKYEMKALQAQINPHFLYNSLSLINWKALEAGQEDISKLTLSLSTFYRTSLNRGRNTLTIEKEIENMKSYLEIQKYMHDDEFDVIMDIDDDILQYYTLNLVLQPLVENSIEHGMSLKEDGRGYIKIIGRKDESKECIYLIVEDNGVGIEPELLESILEFKTRGYGVRNVNQRIKLYYGEEYSLNIESSLGEGTKCTICIPMKKKDDESDYK